MPTTHQLTFLPADRATFELIRSGQKKIETRAGSPAYFKIKAGDTVEFSCGADKITKLVARVEHYKNLDELFAVYQSQEIIPGITSHEELRKKYATFPGYEQRIEEWGILVFGLG